MVGGTDSTFYMDGNSDRQLSNSIWDTAAKLGYKDIFIPQIKYNILDDHIPFIQAGIPSVDIIDIDDKYWLTASDTPDHVSPKVCKSSALCYGPGLPQETHRIRIAKALG